MGFTLNVDIKDAEGNVGYKVKKKAFSATAELDISLGAMRVLILKINVFKKR